jgi:hypothetical protein
MVTALIQTIRPNSQNKEAKEVYWSVAGKLMSRHCERSEAISCLTDCHSLTASK